jgi:hypothetical protein
LFEHVFEDGPVPTSTALDPQRSIVEQLRERVTAMQGGPVRLPVPTHPAIAPLLQLRSGGSYGVDCASLALASVAAASAAGEWVGFAGWGDFGAEAAAELGIDLARTVLVPEPGEHWLEVTAALVDVLKVVVLRPPARVDAKAAGVIDARLRKRSSVLVVWGAWPRCEARLSLEGSHWSGPGSGATGGHGRLRTRRTQLVVRRGTAPAQRADVWFPGEAQPLVEVRADHAVQPVELLEASG